MKSIETQKVLSELPSEIHEGIKITHKGRSVAAIMPLEGHQRMQEEVATRQPPLTLTTAKIPLTALRVLLRSYRKQLAPCLQASNGTIPCLEMTYRGRPIGMLMSWEWWCVLASQWERYYIVDLIKFRAIQMIEEMPFSFFVDFMVESTALSGTQRGKIPRKLRHLFTFKGKNESEPLGEPWNDYFWEAILPQQDLLTFLRARFLPFGREREQNDYEEYTPISLQDSQGNQWYTFQIRLMYQVPQRWDKWMQPLWLTITPSIDQVPPELLQKMTISAEEYQMMSL